MTPQTIHAMTAYTTQLDMLRRQIVLAEQALTSLEASVAADVAEDSHLGLDRASFADIATHVRSMISDHNVRVEHGLGL